MCVLCAEPSTSNGRPAPKGRAPKRECPYCHAIVHTGCANCPACKEKLRADKEPPPTFQPYMGGPELTEALKNRQCAANVEKAFEALLNSEEWVSGWHVTKLTVHADIWR